MLRSMTGFGATSADVDGAHYVVEVRSVNNRFFKALVRVPEELQGIEPEIESALARRLNRGSVVVTVRFSDNSAEAAAQINGQALQRYLEQLRQVPALGDENATLDLGALLSLPGVIVDGGADDRLAEAREVLLRLTDETCAKVMSMRVAEGEGLHRELKRHLEVIAGHLDVIRERVPGVVDQYQQRLRQRMENLLAETGTAVRDEDLLREVAIYAERTDIAEEVARLDGHLEQFHRLIDSADDEPIGRTLDFLSQEMLREANTIASKSLDVEISRRIVETKGAIDRIKEQAQNVE